MNQSEAKPTTKLDYGYGSPIVPDGVFKISPSSASKFFGYTHNWFNEQFLGLNKFEGNSASVRGTMLHFLAECYANNKTISDDDMREINQYLDNQSDNPDVNKHNILSSYEDMWMLLRDWLDTTEILSTEEYVAKQMSHSVVLQGQVDYKAPFKIDDYSQGSNSEPRCLVSDENYMKLMSNPYLNGEREPIIVGDYKSTGAKTMPLKPSYDNIFQARIYAYAMRGNGENVVATEITFIKSHTPGAIGKPTKQFPNGKPGKNYPAEVKTYVEPYTPEIHEIVDGQMKLITETMMHFFEHPELAHILFKDYRFLGQKFNTSKYLPKQEEELF